MGWRGSTSLGVLRDALKRRESSSVVLAGDVVGPLESTSENLTSGDSDVTNSSASVSSPGPPVQLELHNL